MPAPRQPARGLLFAVTLWLALATAILCALCPAGMPRSTAIGSAFSPETTAVALRGRAEQLRAPAKRIIKTEPEALNRPVIAALDPALIAVAPTLPPPQIQGDTFEYHALPLLPDGIFPNAAYPRGPPLS